MSIVAALSCLSVLAASPQGDLRLPPPEQRPAATPVVRPLSELERFRRDLLEMQASGPKVESKLQEMGFAYPQIEPLILEVARIARAHEMGNLMVVARRFGTPKVADELLFQLLARPLAEATRTTVETLAFLKGAEAKKALQECIRGRIAAARRHATDVYAGLANGEDLHFALQLSSEQTLDLQLRGVDLLAAIREDRARTRLVELLSKDPALAGAACDALVRLHLDALPALQQLLAEPPLDRGYAYAAFAVAQIEQASGRRVLGEREAQALLPKLKAVESLTRSLAAIPLADLAHRSKPGGAVAFPDPAIVEVLLDVVAPQQFVPNLDLLRKPAEERLARLTGRLTATAELGWREWWQEQREGFTGLRAELAVPAEQAGMAVVALRQDGLHVRLLGEGLADLPPVAAAQEVVLTAAQMQALGTALQQGGFGDPEAMRAVSGLPLARSLQVQLPGGRSQVAMPQQPHPQFDALVQLVLQHVDAELWQLYRHPQDEPDRAAFWRAERRWLDGNPDPTERGRRFVRRVLQNWPVLSSALRVRALEHLFGRADRKQLLGEADGERILALLRPSAELGPLELRLLELAAGVPGDRVWRDCVDLAARSNSGREAVRGVFAVLGPDAVLAALQDERPLVRRVAIDEVVLVRDLRAGARLVELLADADPEVQRTAAFACGQLQVATAAKALVGLIVAEATPPLVRRECLRALGRVGGELAFPVLERSLASPVAEDKEAALRGLGELRDPRAAHLLAGLCVDGHGKDLGALCRYHLQRMGGILAVPALRHQVQIVQDPAIRTELVLLLGQYQDPQAVPDLLDLLTQRNRRLEAASLLAATTGVDVLAETDQVGVMERWWRQNRTKPQWQWLLDGLKAAAENTSLRAEAFAADGGTAAVPELARLLVECRQPRLWVLAAAVLRTVTGQDYGVVTPQSPVEVREGIAVRYRTWSEGQKAAVGK